MFLFTIIGVFLLAVYGALILYYWNAWLSIPEFLPVSRPFRTRISVLVPARNEAGSIGDCLISLSGQTYPGELYEVIVIDDHSMDGTAEKVRMFGDASATAIQCVRLGESMVKGAGKKKAIETGIQASTGELIVTTDADCRFDPGWLAAIAGFHETTGAKFIAAPVKIGIRKHSFLAVFQTLDFIMLQGITAAAVYRRVHSMCNGANLAYEKKAFYEVGGFEGIDAIPSGDDMLLMHKIYRRYPDQVFFEKSRAVIVETTPAASWRDFVHQRVRWASKADRYDDKRIFWVLLLVYLVNLSFIAVAVAGCWYTGWWWVLLAGLVIKTLVEFPFVGSAAMFFRQESLMIWFPFLQPFHILYTVIVGWWGKFGSYRWKDRKINR